MSTNEDIAWARKETVREVGIVVDADDTESLNNGHPADDAARFSVQTESRQLQPNARTEMDGSQRRENTGSGTLDPDFCLNAPPPDDDGERIPPPISVEPVVDTDEQTRSVPFANGVDPIAPPPVKEVSVLNGSQGEQDSMNHRRAFKLQIWVQRRWKLALFTIVSFGALLLAAIIAIIILAQDQSNGGTSKGGSGASSPPVAPTPPPLFNTIKKRGTLNCGVVEYPGLSVLDNKTGSWSGFEVDLCRAIGAAIFEEDGHVNFIASTNSGRFSLLQSEQVDVLAAGATFTMERDLYEPSAMAGFTFSVPYLYDGLSFAGLPKYVACAEKRLTTGNCTGIRICVQAGTSHVPIVTNLFPDASVVVSAPTTSDFYINFKSGYCNVLAGEQFDLVQKNVQQTGYTGAYNFSQNFYSKEPIALVTRDNDAAWSDFVNWVFLALLTAEKEPVTKAIAETIVQSPGPAIDKSQLHFYQAVATVGNYGEIYKRHLETIIPRAPVNQLNNGSTPLIYSFPFGNNTSLGPGPNGTLNSIRNRGYLLCGTAETPFFAKFNLTAQQWEGFDVDYCRAVSAALFNGVGSTVYVPVTDTNRWELLQNGEIDLLSWDTTWNYDRDVREPSTQTGFSFARADFYTGLQFGGIPPFEACAESPGTAGGPCKELKICVKDGTTIIDDLRKLFLNQTIVPRANDKDVAACLSNNLGNVIAADGFFTAQTTVQEQGYSGLYQTSTKLFSFENLAVVTRQDDPQWSSFVNWIVMATFYAAEQNITQATYKSMPTTNLFGADFALMFQSAILAVGSHSEIIARNSEGIYNISGINTLNTNPFGPQHLPPGGLFGCC